MPAIGFPYNFLRGLSDFWQRFFADADQLEALYKGTAIQIGQAYLDLMSTVLGVSLRDAIALDREYYRMLAIREDDIRFVEGATPSQNRWAYALPDPVVSFASIDNRVVEPTLSLEPNIDYDVVDRVVLFKVDPTNPLGDGLPLNGMARRSIDISVGGRFTDSAVGDWTLALVSKGDTIRILDIGTDGTQRKRSDHPIVLVRTNALYVSDDAPLEAPTTGVVYAILRVPANAQVQAESFTLSGSPLSATLAHTRIDQGSVRVFAKAPGGNDVVEGVDYTVNYEHGKIYALTAWQGSPGPYGIDYTWRKEVYPPFGVSPRTSTTGVIVASTSTVRVLQIAAWCPDTYVDRRTLANNFGAMIGREGESSEVYRAFLTGIFQLYILGPVLERLESALNVVLNLPVVRDDGEVYQSTDTFDPAIDRIFTLRPSTNQIAAYEFPKGTPLRTDLVAGQVLASFEPLTTAVAVTDYVQTPQWWYGERIPAELFTPINGVVPSVGRRTAREFYVLHVVGAADQPQVGDPGLIVGADENGVGVGSPGWTPGHPVFRHRMAFVLMDRYLKFHTFSVKFDALALSATTGTAFAQSLEDLNKLVLSAKPAHTYVFTTPSTFFKDEIEVQDILEFIRRVGSDIFGPDKVIFTDDIPVVGAGIWNVGDYFKYELWTSLTAFPVAAVPVVLANAPAPPRRRRLVRVFVDGFIGGRRLVENVDYTVDYTNCTVTRLTAWTSTTVNVQYRQLNIGNLADAPIGLGDMPLLVNGVDPALITAAFDPSAAGWDGVTTPPTAPRDIGLVERALIVSAHP
jgi:hypothetical protein